MDESTKEVLFTLGVVVAFFAVVLAIVFIKAAIEK